MQLLTIEGFTVAGLRARTINSDEFNSETAKLSQLWGRFFSEGVADKVPNRLDNEVILGVYSDYESDDKGFYSVTAGVKASAAALAPEFETVEVQSGDYLMFEGQGEMPQAVIETWKSVWRYFAEKPKYKRSYATDFELYQSGDRIGIYIGVLNP
jgi:predicted transcriptional regulator YdeE